MINWYPCSVVNTTCKILILCIFILGINTINAKAEFIETEVNDITGKIDHNIFYMSVPERMKIGESYTVRVFIKNTGDERNNFRVMLSTTRLTNSGKTEMGYGYGEFIYPRYDSSVIALEKGESRKVEFKITPIKPYIGDLEVSADLYQLKPKQLLRSDLLLLDHVQKGVRVIEPAFTKDELVLIFSTIIVIIILIFIKLIYISRHQD